jgi:hypothetical protein
LHSLLSYARHFYRRKDKQTSRCEAVLELNALWTSTPSPSSAATPPGACGALCIMCVNRCSSKCSPIAVSVHATCIECSLIVGALLCGRPIVIGRPEVVGGEGTGIPVYRGLKGDSAKVPEPVLGGAPPSRALQPDHVVSSCTESEPELVGIVRPRQIALMSKHWFRIVCFGFRHSVWFASDLLAIVRSTPRNSCARICPYRGSKQSTPVLLRGIAHTSRNSYRTTASLDDMSGCSECCVPVAKPIGGPRVQLQGVRRLSPTTRVVANKREDVVRQPRCSWTRLPPPLPTTYTSMLETPPAPNTNVTCVASPTCMSEHSFALNQSKLE